MSTDWCLAVEVSGRPGVDVSESAVRIEPEDGSLPIIVPFPDQAQPIDVSSVSVKFSRKRNELLVRWPRSATAQALGATEQEKEATSISHCSTSASDESASDESDQDHQAAAPQAPEVEAPEPQPDIQPEIQPQPQAEIQRTDDEIDKLRIKKEELETARAQAENEVAEAERQRDALLRGLKGQAEASPEADALAEATSEVARPQETVEAHTSDLAPSDGESYIASGVAAPTKSVDEWKALGNEAVKTGDHAAAVKSYSAGLAIEPAHAILLSNRALCLHKMGNLQEALTDAKNCISLRPDFFKGFLRAGLILRELGRPQEALEMLRKSPPNNEVEKLAGEVRPEAEAAEAKRIAGLSGAEKTKEEGNLLFKKGLFEHAIVVYEKALSMCDDPVGEIALAIRNNRAGCYHQLSNYELVIQDTNFVLEQQPDNLKALVRRMIALEPLEKYEAALKDARRVLASAPGNEVANKVQHRLSKLVRDRSRG